MPMIVQSEKLVFVLVTFLLVTETTKKDIVLEKISYIFYLLHFQKNTADVKV